MARPTPLHLSPRRCRPCPTTLCHARWYDGSGAISKENRSSGRAGREGLAARSRSRRARDLARYHARRSSAPCSRRRAFALRRFAPPAKARGHHCAFDVSRRRKASRRSERGKPQEPSSWRTARRTRDPVRAGDALAGRPRAARLRLRMGTSTEGHIGVLRIADIGKGSSRARALNERKRIRSQPVEVPMLRVTRGRSSWTSVYVAVFPGRRAPEKIDEDHYKAGHGEAGPMTMVSTARFDREPRRVDARLASTPRGPIQGTRQRVDGDAFRLRISREHGVRARHRVQALAGRPVRRGRE